MIKTIFNNNIFDGIDQDFLATRYHSLVVDKQSLPESLVVTAETKDGLIMGFNHIERPVFGVQFHPESIATDFGYKILANFLRIAGLKGHSVEDINICLLYTSPSPRDRQKCRMPSSA